MKKFTIACDIADVTVPYGIYVGEPRPGKHPLQHQASWLSRTRSGKIPPEVMDSLQDLLDTAKRDNVSFEELCVDAMSEDPEGDSSDDTTVEPA